MLDEPALRLDDLRLAAALAHSVPGVAIRFRTDVGYDVLVAHHHLDAAMSPCQLRSLVGTVREGGSVPLVDRFVEMHVVAGLEHIGGGVHRRCAGGTEERWIATLLAHETVLDVLREYPVDLPSEVMAARVAVDTVLGTAAVCFTAAHDLWLPRLDEVAVWAQSACLVAELTADPVGQPRG